MNLIKKLRSITVLAFVCICLLSASFTSCNPKSEAGEENTENAAEEDGEKKADHPAGEHPKADTTKVDSTEAAQ
jgi:hypothetical protein